MAENTIIWTRTASKQLPVVLSFWNKRTHSNRFSNKLLAKIDQRLALVASFPFEHPQSSLPKVRVAAMNHYSLFYKVQEARRQNRCYCFLGQQTGPQKIVKHTEITNSLYTIQRSFLILLKVLYLFLAS